MLPVSFTAAYVVVWLVCRWKKQAVRIVVLVAALGTIALSGQKIYSRATFTEAENEYKLPQAALDVADILAGAGVSWEGLFFAALPTTAGTGAEITNNAVLTDRESRIKQSLRHPSMVADAAVVDPDLTLSCPRELTAFSGLDAFVQAFESFTSPRSSALTRALAAEAVRKIFHSLEEAWKEPENIRARTEMAEASMLSGMAFSQTGLGAVHGLAHPVGSLLGVPHGLACAILMRPVLEFNLPVCSEQYADLADRTFIGSDARSFLRAAGDLAEKLEVPENLRSFALHRSDFEFIIKNCRSASMKQNPREMTDRDVEAILEKML